jgi:ketosteroid isomerase-like protein
MSEENVDRFLEATDAFNREDYESYLRLMAPDIDFEPQQAALQGSYVGLKGVRGWLDDLAEHYAGGSLRFPDVRDLGDRVLALGSLHFTGKGSGIETEVPVAIVATFRDGRVTHLKDYGDPDKALEAAGLSE